MLVIVATLEAEIRETAVLGEPGQIVRETPSQKIPGCSGSIMSSQATKKGDIERITVPGQSRQKVSESPISTNKLDMVANACHPSLHRKMVV
jgi:hypothetical protein